jgi:hypothetical protein
MSRRTYAGGVTVGAGGPVAGQTTSASASSASPARAASAA